MVKYFIDTESLLTIQKLFEVFSYRKIGTRKEFLKKYDIGFASLQKNRRVSRLAIKLYQRIYTAWTPEQIQTLCLESNRLISKLILKYGDFTKDPVWDDLDGLSRFTLTEIAQALVSK